MFSETLVHSSVTPQVDSSLEIPNKNTEPETSQNQKEIIGPVIPPQIATVRNSSTVNQKQVDRPSGRGDRSSKGSPSGVALTLATSPALSGKGEASIEISSPESSASFRTNQIQRKIGYALLQVLIFAYLLA
jgi:hypothetical protein